MKEITKKFKNNIKYDLSKISDVKRLLFFDIETTGLSPKNSNLYLIGSINIDNDTVIFKQWFCESLSDETSVLQAFFEYAADFDTLISENVQSSTICLIRLKPTKVLISTKR